MPLPGWRYRGLGRPTSIDQLYTGLNEEWTRLNAALQAMPTNVGPVFNARDAGARGNGLSDDTAALQRAFSATQAAQGVLYIPAGVYRYSAKLCDITTRMAVFGAGKRQTFLQPISSMTDWALTITDAWRSGGETVSSTSFNPLSSEAGISLQGFSIVGNRATSAQGIATLGIVDFLNFQDLGFIDLNGTALQLGVQDYSATSALGCVRESYFENLFFELCGNLTNPAFDIGNGTAGTGDGTNDLTFVHAVFANNKGIHWRMKQTHSGSTMRQINGYGIYLNGDASAGSPTAADLLQIEGAVVGVHLDGLQISGSTTVSAVPYAAIRVSSNATGTPDRIHLVGDIVSLQGDGYVIDQCSRITIAGTSQVSGAGVTELKVAASQASTFELTYNVTSQQSISGRQALLSIGDEDAASKIRGLIQQNAPLTATDADTTPDVRNVSFLFFNNTNPTTVTDFDFGGKSQFITVAAATTDGGTTLSHGASLILVGGTDRLLHRNESCQFVHNGSTQWIEIGPLALQQIDRWTQDNVAASQTNVELTRAEGRFQPTRAGSVVGVAVISTEARTAGTLTVKVFKNTGLAGAAGAQLGSLTAVLDGTNTSEADSHQRAGLSTFAANDELYLAVTTDGSWTPTTADIRCTLEISV